MNRKINDNSKQMIHFLVILFGIIFLLMIGKFGYIASIKTVNGTNLIQFMEDRRTRESIDLANRGTIYDRYGNIIASNINEYSIYAIIDKDYPNHVEDMDQTATLLSQYTSCTYDYLFDRLNQSDGFQVEFGTCGRIDSITKARLDDFDLPGIGFNISQKREYPINNFSSYNIGYTGVDGDTLVGLSGLEAYYNDSLRGIDGHTNYYIDGIGYINKILDGSNQKIDGYNIYTTIDSQLQMVLSNALDYVDVTYKPEESFGILMNVHTGDILALDQRPTFDLSTLDISNYNNLITQEPFEPGSTMKPYVYATAIDLGKYDSSQTYMSGQIDIMGNTIRDWNEVGWGEIPIDEGLYRSSNVGIATILTTFITPFEYSEYLTKFGFGQVPSIDLPNASSGTIPKNEFMLITSGFGQGMTSTPIQHIQAFSTFFNDGKSVIPHLLSKMTDNSGNEIFTYTPQFTDQIIQASTAHTMQEMLINAIEGDASVAKKYRLDNYVIAGKTGTAQIAENGGYIADNYFYSFISCAPADDPQYILYVGVKKPTQGDTNHVLSIYQPVMRAALKQYEQQKTETQEHYFYTVDDFIGNSTDLVKYRLQSLHLDYYILGDDTTVIAQLPAFGEVISDRNKVFILTDGPITLPDMTGWSLKDIQLFSQLTNIPITYIGHGFVINQSINSGQIVDENDIIKVTLSE